MRLSCNFYFLSMDKLGILTFKVLYRHIYNNKYLYKIYNKIDIKQAALFYCLMTDFFLVKESKTTFKLITERDTLATKK